MPEEMGYLAIVADEIHDYDPLGRPVAIYSANNLSQDNLETVASNGLDWTVMGVYATTTSFDTRGARVADGVDRIVKAAETSSTVPISVFELVKDHDASDLAGLQASLGYVSASEAIEHVIRHDVYQGLVRGIKGVHVWSGCDCRPIEDLSTYSEQLEGYISVAKDINGPLSL